MTSNVETCPICYCSILCGCGGIDPFCRYAGACCTIRKSGSCITESSPAPVKWSDDDDFVVEKKDKKEKPEEGKVRRRKSGSGFSKEKTPNGVKPVEGKCRTCTTFRTSLQGNGNCLECNISAAEFERESRGREESRGRRRSKSPTPRPAPPPTLSQPRRSQSPSPRPAPPAPSPRPAPPAPRPTAPPAPAAQAVAKFRPESSRDQSLTNQFVEHTNKDADGKLVGTYSSHKINFVFEKDGTRRVVELDVTGLGLIATTATHDVLRTLNKQIGGLFTQNSVLMQREERSYRDLCSVVKTQNKLFDGNDSFIIALVVGLIIYCPDVYGDRLADEIWGVMDANLQILFSEKSATFESYRKAMFPNKPMQRRADELPIKPSNFNLQKTFVLKNRLAETLNELKRR